MKRPRVAAPVWSWDEALQDFLTKVRDQRGVSRQVQQHYRRVLVRLTRFLADKGVPAPASCTVQAVEAWLMQTSRRGLKGKTINNYVRVLRYFFEHVREAGQGPELATLLEGPRVFRDSAVPVHFSWSEIQQLLVTAARTESPHRRRDLALLWLLCTTGIRIQEVARLTLADVDLAHGTMILRYRKTAEPVAMPLVAEASRALDEYLRLERPQDASHPQVFLTQHGQPFAETNRLSNIVRHLVLLAGLGDHRGPQAIRRGLGTRMLETGASLTEIALLLGHGSYRSSIIYLRASVDQLREVADNYANLF